MLCFFIWGLSEKDLKIKTVHIVLENSFKPSLTAVKNVDLMRGETMLSPWDPFDLHWVEQICIKIGRQQTPWRQQQTKIWRKKKKTQRDEKRLAAEKSAIQKSWHLAEKRGSIFQRAKLREWGKKHCSRRTLRLISKPSGEKKLPRRCKPLWIFRFKILSMLRYKSNFLNRPVCLPLPAKKNLHNIHLSATERFFVKKKNDAFFCWWWIVVEVAFRRMSGRNCCLRAKKNSLFYFTHSATVGFAPVLRLLEDCFKIKHAYEWCQMQKKKLKHLEHIGFAWNGGGWSWELKCTSKQITYQYIYQTNFD